MAQVLWKKLYEATDLHKIIFIKNLLDFSDDYARSTAKENFWYLDMDDSTVTADAGTNPGIKTRGMLAHAGNIVERNLPLNRYSFFEGLSDRLLPPMHLEFEIQFRGTVK